MYGFRALRLNCSWLGCLLKGSNGSFAFHGVHTFGCHAALGVVLTSVILAVPETCSGFELSHGSAARIPVRKDRQPRGWGLVNLFLLGVMLLGVRETSDSLTGLY